MKNFKIILTALFLISFTSCAKPDFEPDWEHLLSKLSASSRDSVIKWMADGSLEFNEKIIRRMFLHIEYKADYEKFLKTESLNAGKKFLKNNAVLLNQISKKYDVEPEILVAIAQIETKLGEYVGNYSVLSVYSSLGMADNENYFERINELVSKHNPEKYLENGKEEGLKKRIKSRAAWAREQLEAVIGFSGRLHSVTELKGSFAGAFGFVQFIPSSYRDLAVDGDDDGKTDLYNWADAFASAANYLSQNGYKSKADTEAKRNAIYSYNHSTPYVDTILEYAAEIKK